MTTPDNEQPEALQLLEWFAEANGFSQGNKAPHKWVLRTESELRRQNAEIEQLKAQLSQAQAVPTETLATDYAKRLSRCRDAFPIPAPNSELEALWIDALGCPSSVPEFVEAMLAASPAPPAQQKYRLLVRGVDVIEPADEFLQEDGVSWATCSIGIFVGMPYRGSALLPARRPLGIGAALGIQGEGN